MSNKWMRSFMCVISAVVMLISASCNNQKTVSNSDGGITSTTEFVRKTVSEDTPPSWKGDQSEFKLDWYVNLSWWKWNGLYGTDLVSKMIKEKTGATINFIIPATDGNEQLSTMVASGTLPDVVTIDAWSDMRSKLAKDNYLHSVNDLMNEYAPTFWNTIHEDIFNWFKEKDGKVYGFPNYAYSSDDIGENEQLEPNGCIVVREDLYNAIGKPDMTTPEGFLAACEKVKNEVKTYDGKPIIPLQLYEFTSSGNTSLLWLSQYFHTPYEDQGGQFLYDILQPNYLESIQFLNNAYRRGLISDANLSDTRDMINERIARGSVFALISAPQDFTGAFSSLYQKDAKAKYITVALKNSKGEDPILQDIRGFGWQVNLITKNAKKPDRIIKLFEYLYSTEGQMDVHFGKEGVTYNWNKDKTGIVWTDEYKKAVDDGSAAKYGLSAMNLMANYAQVMNLYPEPEKEVDKYIKHLKDPMKKYSYDFSAKFLKSDPTDSRTNEMSDKQTKINYYWGKQLPKIVTASSEENCRKLYEKTVEEMKGKGLDTLVEYQNSLFQKGKNELGLERSWPPLRTSTSAGG